MIDLDIDTAVSIVNDYHVSRCPLFISDNIDTPYGCIPDANQRVGNFAFAIACKFDQPIIHPPHSLDESRITRLGASQVRVCGGFDVIVKFASEGKLAQLGSR